MNVLNDKKSLIATRGRGRRLNTVLERSRIDNFPQPSGSSGAFQRFTNQRGVKNVTTNNMKTPTQNFLRSGTSSSARRSGRRKSSTPYRVTESSSSSRAQASLPIIVAITEGRGDARGEVGIAAVNVQYPHLILSQISERHTYVNTLTKILILKPVEIIMPETMIGKSGTAGKLFESIKEKFPTISIAGVSRQHFNNANGLDRIRNLSAPKYSSVELYVKQKFYALAAAAALLKYVEYTKNILYIPNSMKLEFQSSVDTTFIDVDSAENLELVAHQENSTNFTLLGVLDRCVTPGGKRFLRASILQPSCNERLIKERQMCVAEMVEDTQLFTSVQALIRRLCDVDRLLVLGLNTPQKDNMSSAEKNLNYAIALKTTLETIPFLQTALRNAQANFFRKVLKNLEDPRFNQIMNTILEVLQPDARHTAGFNSATMQRCFALKSGLNDMLDIVRQAYCELIDDMKGLVETLALKYNLPFTLACSASLGYHIQMDTPRRGWIKPADLPSIFIEVQKQKNNYVMTTEVLLVLSQRCKDACEELHLMSNIMLTKMLNAIREHIGCLYQLSSNISELDVIVSLASISSLPNYTQPVFSSRIELKNSMHPLMDIAGRCVPVGNDVDISPTHNFNVITGPNMGGKSIYLRQIVMLQIMAQIGCYVPAEKAIFRIADCIFCRICFGDSIESNASSFVLEIKESQYILQMVTPKSLVVMDELCRGTTVEEGESIAFAICEQLLNTSAFVFFTTHFLFLTKLAEWYPNVRNYHFEIKYRSIEGFTEPRFIYTHKLLPGITPVKNYGLALAETCGVPGSVMKMARGIAAKLINENKPTDAQFQASDKISRKSYNEVSLMHRLIEDGEFSEEKVLEIVQRLHNCGISTSDGELCNLDSEAVTCTSRSSMLSITERFDRLKKKRLLNPSTSDSDFIPRKQFIEPQAGPSNSGAFSEPIRSLVAKESPNMESPNSNSRRLDIPILAASGLSEWSAFTKLGPKQESDFGNLKSPYSDSRSMNISIWPASGPKQSSPFITKFVSETRAINTPIIVAREPSLVNFTPQREPNLIERNDSNPKSELVKTCISQLDYEVEERKGRPQNCISELSPITIRSTSQSTIDLISQVSIETIKARISAREKEARIFREIEGDQFRELEFYESVISRAASFISDNEDQ